MRASHFVINVNNWVRQRKARLVWIQERRDRETQDMWNYLVDILLKGKFEKWEGIVGNEKELSMIWKTTACSVPVGIVLGRWEWRIVLGQMVKCMSLGMGTVAQQVKLLLGIPASHLRMAEIESQPLPLWSSCLLMLLENGWGTRGTHTVSLAFEFHLSQPGCCSLLDCDQQMENLSLSPPRVPFSMSFCLSNK